MSEKNSFLGVQVVNLDYVIKLREYPYNKKGRKLLVTFVAHTKFGSVRAQKEVDV